jgi:N-acetyl-gamma-glutamyl-phosphate reductase
MIKVAIVGATGYTAREAIRILQDHPQVQIEKLTSDSKPGSAISDIFPQFERRFDKVTTTDADIDSSVDAVIITKKDFYSMKKCPGLLKKGLRVIDLSADFRLKDSNLYPTWYKHEHNSPELLSTAVYGLTEIYRDDIRRAQLVANPGCYPVSVILGCAPLFKNRLVDATNVIVDSMSGISGAGRNSNQEQYLFCERDGNVKPYSIGTHRHTPEMEQELSNLAREKVVLTFSPYLAPMERGIMSTIYLSLKEEHRRLSSGDLYELYNKFYEGEPFVRIRTLDKLSTEYVAYSNFCDIGLFVDTRKPGRVVVMSAIDNLVKGAAGQAVQNLNVMFGIEETAGLLRSRLGAY